MKIEKSVFDATLKKILRAKPMPKSKVKSNNRRGPKTPILAKP
jgi:hypothetical protein